MKYFKVIDSFSTETTIDTSTTRYSLTLDNKSVYSEFIELIIEFSDKFDLPFDFLVSFNNNLAIWGNIYLENIPKSKNGAFEISDLTNNVWHKNFFIQESVLIAIIENLNVIGIRPFGEGFYLWEDIFDKVRYSKYPDKPKREESFFLFDTIQNCEYYINEHKGGGIICEVEILECHSLFKADMSLFDRIPNNYTFKQAERQAINYWAGEISDNPIHEYLFQGTCKLKSTDLNNVYSVS